MTQKTKFQQEQEAERLAHEHGVSREMGFELMKVRDQGWARIRPRAVSGGKSVAMEWNTDARQKFPKGHFMLHIGDEYVLLSAEEFRKVLRWV